MVMVAIGVFFPIAINSTAGVLQINQVYLDVGKSFKASRWDTFRTIALARRAALHHDRREARRRHCAHSDCGTEMVGAKSGIGYMIWSAWEIFAVPKMYVGLFTIALIGFAVTFLLREVERLVIRWKPDV